MITIIILDNIRSQVKIKILFFLELATESDIKAYEK